LRLDGVIGGENTCQTLLVSDRPLTELAPARRTSAGPAVVELGQHLAESAGLIPTPIQSLKEAGRMQRCLERIRQRRGVEIDLDRIPLDDPAAFDSICLGESDLTDVMGDSMTREMREYSDRGQPRSLTDLSALFALYRPGPINAGIVEQFFWRKRHPLLYPAPSFPVLTEILEETRGLWVYQEQFMAAAAAVAGFSPSDAEKMWREIVRRRSREIELWRARFIEGAAARGADPKDAERLFEDFEKDAPSSFMKAHAIHLALMIYRGAWLKAHYPEEFDASEGENS
jgi:DNA polymerase-3 subunit alpha